MRKRVALFAFALAAGCGGPKEQPKPVYAPPPPVVDAWVLGTRDARAEEPALLWNGLIGIRILRDGAGGAFFAIDEYETTGEEKIRMLPNPLGVGANGLIDLNRPYDQSLDMRSAVLTTRYTRVDGVQVTTEHVLHPSKRMIAERVMLIGSDRNVVVGISTTPPRPVGGMKVAVNATCDDKPLDDANAMNLPARGRMVIERTISLGGSSNAARMRAASLPENWEEPEEPLSYNDIYQASLEAWRKRWQTDIEIDGPVEDQQAVRSFMFYLRSAIHPEGDMSISPFGLSDTQYNGHVFWDADIWVFPALAFIDPDAAKEIPEYRMRTVLDSYFGYSPGKLGSGIWKPLHPKTADLKRAFAMGSPEQIIRFPWESSVTGKETAPIMQEEIHISGSVAWSMNQAVELGLMSGRASAEVFQGVDNFYRNRGTKGRGGLLELKGVVSPDEHHTGDNDLYTNLLADWVGGQAWPRQPSYYLPKDAQTFLTYDDDRLRGYKQAAAVLSIYPLQYPPAEKQARQMMDRFSDKVTKNGPAMTDSVHSVIWSRLGEKEKAYTAWKASWEPFTRHPLMLFSEKRVRSKTYFTTGAGGALQSVLYGFLGMRLDWRQEPGSAWSTRLRGDNWLSVKPNLPPSWKSVKFRNFTVLGRRLTLSASPSAVQVVPGG